jgi:hypothetical protein
MTLLIYGISYSLRLTKALLSVMQSIEPDLTSSRA